MPTPVVGFYPKSLPLVSEGCFSKKINIFGHNYLKKCYSSVGKSKEDVPPFLASTLETLGVETTVFPGK
jgi:hypothetical protein